jgi:hypothetical protein
MSLGNVTRKLENALKNRTMIPFVPFASLASLAATSLVVTTAMATAGCAASMPAPTQSLADAQSAERSASELGAAGQPKAQLHLQLAHDQIAQATAAMKDGDNERASGLLMRARADAELAIALTRDQSAKTGAEQAVVKANAQQTVNANQGAAQ